MIGIKHFDIVRGTAYCCQWKLVTLGGAEYYECYINPCNI